MAALPDGLNVLVQGGANFPVGPISVGVRVRNDGTVSGEGSVGVYSGRGSYNPVTGEWSLAVGLGRSWGSYNSVGGRKGVFVGVGLDQNGVFVQVTGTINFPIGNGQGTPYFTGLRVDYKIPVVSYDEIKKFLIPLYNVFRDPLVLDLNGDGIVLSALAGSTVHFDYAGDGFSELTGWASPEDGILAIDDNGNGTVDNGLELFGSSTQDGFAVLEKLDSNGDGTIDSQDADFAKLRIWRDVNQDGVSQASELETLTQAGVTSISLNRVAVNGTNNGNGVGYEAQFVRADGSSGVAQTIYFQTDNQQSVADHTPQFTPADGVEYLPQLPGSGLIDSIAYKATNDTAFREAWTTLTEDAGSIGASELQARFEALILKWAGVDSVDPTSRGPNVDARHLAFVEKFFGDTYREIQRGEELRTYPSTPALGNSVENSFQDILGVLRLLFLTQVTTSVTAMTGSAEAALDNPYFAYGFLDLVQRSGDDPPPDSPANIAMVVDLIIAQAPYASGAAIGYLTKALFGLNEVMSLSFNGNRAAYSAEVLPLLNEISDTISRDVATHVVDGTGLFGSTNPEAINGTSSQDVFIGGGGGDLLSGGNGGDIYVYNKQDGNLWIKDEGAATDTDRLVLTDLNSTDVTFDRIGDDLLMRITATGKTVDIESFFAGQGVDVLRFADGTEWDRTQLKSFSVFRGDGQNNYIADSGSHDVIRGGKGDDYITISGGNDTIFYSKGDGYDVVHDTIGQVSDHDTFVLTDLNADDIQLSRVGGHLLLTVKSTGEYVDFDNFFPNNSGDRTTKNIDIIKFADGTSWDRADILQRAWYRGTDGLDSIVTGSELNDTIYGGKGDDFLQGWTGSDTYVWKKGDGNDEIDDFSSKIGDPNNSDVDTLWLQDVSAGEVSYSYQGGTLLITINTTGEIIRVDSFFSGVTSLLDGNAGNWVGIDQIKFQDGSVIDRAQITYNAGRDYLGWDPVVVTMVEQGLIVWQTYWDEFGHEGNIVAGASPGIDDIWNASSYGGLGGTLGIPDALQPNPFHGGGNNILNGSGNVDIMAGGLGADVLNGFGGNDVLYGDLVGSDTAGGNDVLLGGYGDDVLYGGGGSDYLDGWIGNDFISGGDGKDYILANDGDDIIIGGKGDDFIYNNNGAGSGNDTYIYAKGDGNDLIVEGSSPGTDVLILTDLTSDEVELSQQADDLLIKIKATGEIITVAGHFLNRNGSNNADGMGLEYIRFANVQWDRAQIGQNAWFRGTDGRDILDGQSTLSDIQRDETFDGGKGNDIIYSGRSSDTFVYASGDGNDIIYDGSWHATGSSINDTLKLTDLNAANVELTRSGEDLLIKVLTTGEIITVASQFASGLIDTGGGIEFIQFANGEQWNRLQIQQNAWFRGTDGIDLIDARNSRWDDTIEGGKGDDIIYTGLQSGSGNDTFIYSKGDGNDTIYENTWRSFTSTETDVLFLKDIQSSEVNLTRSGDNLLVHILATNETITIVGQFGDSSDTPDSGIEYIRFANGDQWGRSTIYGLATSNAPFFAGTSGNDILTGSSASQNFYGEAGDDRIDGQGGNDLLYGGLGNDTLVLSVSAPGDVASINGGVGTDTLDLSGFGSAAWVDLVTNGAEVRTTDQSDLSSGTWRDMAQVEQVENITGTAFSDQIAGDAGNNVIVGGAGNDVVDARSGNDTVLGGSGDDTLTGGMGNDVLDGGTGVDILVGGLDSDVLIGGAGNDVLTGGTGGDIFVVGVDDGSDTITDFTAGSGTDHDMVRFDRTMFADFASVIAAASQSGSDVVITLGNGDSLTLQNVDLAALTADNFEFRRLGNEAPTGITVTGGSVQENAAGGTVVATLAAVDVGDAGAHSFSIVGTDNLFEVVGNQIRVKDGAILDFETQSQHALTIKTVDDDGMSTTTTIVIGITDQVETTTGTSGSDVLTAGAGSDILVGGAGDDRLLGGGGSDEYRYNLGDGSDRIVETGGNSDTDRLVLGSGIDPATTVVGRSSLDNSDVVLRLSNGQTIVLENQLSMASGGGLEQISFADGTVWSRSDILSKLDPHLLIAGAGTSTVVGSGSDDVFVAGAASRTLTGFGGSDTYKVGASADQLVISEDAEAGTDRLELVGLNAADVTFIQRGVDLVVKNKANGHITTITNQFGFAPTGVEQVAFADGTVWDKTQIASHVVLPNAAGSYTVVGTSGDDTFQPGAGNDLIEGGAGSDTIVYAFGDGSDTIADGYNSASQVDVLKFADLRSGDLVFSRQGADLTIAIPGAGDTITVQGQFTSAGEYWGLEQIQFSDGSVWDRAAIAAAAWIRGSAAAETLNGSADPDTIDGGGGADTLSGGDSGDTYIYHAGSGNDVIVESSTDSGADTLKLVGLNATDVTFSQAGSDLLMRVTASGEVLTVKDQFDGVSGIERVVFASGASWTRSELLYNLSGAGVFFFHPGDGQLTLDSSVGVVRMDAAIAPGDVILQANGNDLIVKLRGTSDSITMHADLATNPWGVSSTLHQLIFSDGSVLDIGQPAAGLGQPITFTWLGNAANFDITGSGYGTNVYESTIGGRFTFVDSSGVGGANIVKFDKGAQNLNVRANNISGRIELGSQIAAQDVYWQTNQYGDLIMKLRGDTADSINVWGDLQLANGAITSAIKTVSFSDGTVLDMSHGPSAFTWLGNTTNFNITGATLGTNVYEVTAAGTINFVNSGAVGGTNIVKYDRGSQNLIIWVNNDAGSIELGPNISAQDVYWQSNQYGDLNLRIRGDSTDGINAYGDLKVVNGVVTSSIGTIKFSDGTVLDMSHGPSNFTWLGNAANFNITGTTFGTNIYEVTAANGKINFADTGAVGGTNIVKFDKGGLSLNVQANNFSGELDLGATISAQDVYWQSNGYGDLIMRLRGDDADSINVWGDLHVVSGALTSAIKTVKFSDGSVLDMSHGPSNFTWLGNTANFTLTGTTFGTNIYEVTAANGKINFADASAVGGINVVKFDKGDLALNVQANNFSGELDLGATISAQDVYWQSNGYGDLIMRLRGDDANSINVWGDLHVSNGALTSAIKTVKFSDGTVLDMSHGPSKFNWLGNTANFTLTGTAFGTNIYEVTAANGKINFADAGTVGGINIVKFDKGGQALNVQANNFSGEIDLGATIQAQDVYWQTNGYGDLILKLRGDDADSINVWGDLHFTNGVVTSAIKNVKFSDGTVLDMTQGPSAFTWIGTANNYNLVGSNLRSNVFEIAQGNGAITFGNASGGGDGNNTIRYDIGDGLADVQLNGGKGIITFGSNVSAQDVILQSNANGDLIVRFANDTSDKITVHNDLVFGNVNSYGISTIQFADGTAWDYTFIASNAWIRGTAGNETINLPVNAATVDAGAGDDTLSVSGSGSDRIVFGVGSGHDVLDNPGNGYQRNDVLDLTGLLPSDISLSRSGNQLIVTVLATGETFTALWQFYGGGLSYGLGSIKFADGTVWDRTVIAAPVTIEAAGSTSLLQSGSNYALNSISTGTGPTLKYNGSAVTVGQFGAWTPIGAEQVSGGYDVALKNTSTGVFSFWSTDSNGNFVSNLIPGELAGNSAAVTSLETIFHQDLNGDGATGVAPVTIEAAGSTSLVQIGSYYCLDGVGMNTGTGPMLRYGGSVVTVGQFGAWTPIGAEQVSGGYDVVLKNSSSGMFSFWSTDSNGNYVSNLPDAAGDSASVLSMEATFHQDLNGDGVVSGAPVILDLDGDGVSVSPLGTSSAAFDMNGDGRRVPTAWAAPGDAFLAIDLDGRGIIDQARQIEFTQWAPGTTSDMQALRQVFDTNHNCELDPNDALWSEFRIWQDANGDGVSNTGEVRTLDQVGITSIDLNPTGPAQWLSDGSVISGLSSYTRSDGTKGLAGDVTLAYSAVRPASGGEGGGLGIDGQISQLVQAMATYSANNTGFDPTSSGIQTVPNGTALQTAVAAAWHA
ncbi:Ca2+-binding protein, RTX toxin [Bradyrhizobium sp. YR681]|uniref:calcium-binding protein n=1 Tax=Bradyrhizobium sp. YR681 TaxID=1144344 RepID=UPI00026FC2D3|nr:calcium-binding protein [Bradyrhizobium sp. YR681]EJN08763.1 Ca2+-binding protein, RTX toxin [Bradyrhizobium sp. YR681]